MLRIYVDQYWLTTNFIPMQLQPLCTTLEECKGNDAISGQPGKKQHTPSNNGMDPSEKDGVHRIDKFCQSCHDHGDTTNCRKYDVKGTLLNLFGKSKKTGDNRARD